MKENKEIIQKRREETEELECRSESRADESKEEEKGVKVS